MKKKLYIIVFVIVLIVISCVPSAAEKVTLRYAHWGMDIIGPSMEASIAEFMKNNPDIDVQKSIGKVISPNIIIKFKDKVSKKDLKKDPLD